MTEPTPASINAYAKLWVVNSGEYTPDGDGSHWGAFWEPLQVDLPKTARPTSPVLYGGKPVTTETIRRLTLPAWPQAAKLFSPPDIESAYQLWGANCGPAALAAILHCPVADTKALFDGFAARRYVNPTHMREAIAKTGLACEASPKIDNDRRQWPRYGLAFIQFMGEGWRNSRIQEIYRHTHWVAVALTPSGRTIYDVNAGGWQRQQGWELTTLHELMLAEGADEWFVRTGINVFDGRHRHG